MNTKRQLFGKSKDEIRKQLCEHPNFSLQKGDTEQSDKIIAESGQWKVIFDIHTIHTHHDIHEFSRIRSPFLNEDEFRFVLHKESLLDSLAKLIGMQDIKIGNEKLDNQYIIQSNNEEKIKRLFSDQELVNKVLQYQPVYFGIRDDEGFYAEDYPKGVDELYLLMEDVITDANTLNDVFDLFSRALHLLSHMDPAYEDDPQLTI